jgi:hypothetical protein
MSRVLTGGRMSQRGLFLAAALAGVMTSGCTVAEYAPAGINCSKIRALTVGMSTDDARNLLGSTFEETRKTKQVVIGGPDNADMHWRWPNKSNGVRLSLYFADNRLVSGQSYIRTDWRDFTDESRPVLFELASAGLKEGNDFRRIYCPD